ncbi:MAG: metal-dependent hydrolase [Candidatus Poribacteria bacterium]
MAGHAEHARAAVRFYALFLLGAVLLWLARGPLTLDTLPYTLPISDEVWRTALSIALCFALALIGAAFPDTDIKSRPQVLFYRALFVADAALIALYYARDALIYLHAAAFLGLAAMAPLLGRHRGWTHSRLSMVAVPSPLVLGPMLAADAVVWVGLPYYLAAVVGYASHLYKDGILFRR